MSEHRDYGIAHQFVDLAGVKVYAADLLNEEDTMYAGYIFQHVIEHLEEMLHKDLVIKQEAILQEQVQNLLKHAEAQDRMILDRGKVIDQLTKERDHHKCVRKAITRQLKDVEKARKYEFCLYVDKFTTASDVIKSLKNEIQQLKKDYPNFLARLFG